MKLPEKGLTGRAVAFVRFVKGLRIPVYASHASFFIALSVFPTLVLLLSLLRYTGLEVELLTEMLHGIVPTALMPFAQKLIINTYNSTTGTLVSVSAVTALWSAGRGIYGLITGLNVIYDTVENRGYFRTRAVSVLYTFGFLLVLIATLVLHVFGTGLLQWLPFKESPLLQLLRDIVDLRFFLLLFLQTALFTAVFMVLPNRRNRFSESFPGAVLASIGWLAFSDLYSIYVERFATLSNVYGSVYAVALSMLWLYFCMCIVFYGGALNHFLISKRKKGHL